MKRYERFVFQGRRYKFLNWEADGSAHAIDIATEQETWLTGVARSRLARQRDNGDWMRQQRQAQVTLRTNWDVDMDQNRDRLQEESEQILLSVPAIREAILRSLIEAQQSDSED